MTNPEIAAQLETIARILTLHDENPFRIRAYSRAATMIENLSDRLSSIYEKGGVKGLQELPGIGPDLSLKIEELLKTGKLEYLENLEKTVPEGLFTVMQIQQMGPKKTSFLWKKFKVTSVEDLEKLLQTGKLLQEKGWGEKSVENIRNGIDLLKSHTGRVSRGVAKAAADELSDVLSATGLCKQLSIAGSLRRGKETAGDVDILVSGTKVEKIMDAFVGASQVVDVIARGETKVSVRLASGLQADLRVIADEVFGAALHYFTGSKDHNIRIRSMGIATGLTISEWGVHKGTAAKKGKLLPSATEEDVFASVGLPYIPPELRENSGEFEEAMNGALPTLIEEKDLRGDLHMHSDFSDGTATIVDMAKAGKKAGYEYIAIADHASPMGMVKGIKEKNIDEYIRAVEAARESVPGMHILAGAEVDIMVDGSLFLSDTALKKLDWVVASVHGHFALDEEEQTKCVCRALAHPLVKVLAHPTGRLIQEREPIRLNFDAVLAAAKKHGKILEMNASVDRLDLSADLARKAKNAGVLLIINSDAHAVRGLSKAEGITQARRGWIKKNDVVNTRNWKEFEKLLAR